ncbi:MAG: carbonic anhydrase, partial [Flavobacteriales bacterium]
FACKLAKTKLILVLGHSHCGAVKGACDRVEMGNLTAMLSKITPAVDKIEQKFVHKGSMNAELVQAVADENVKNAIRQIREQSEILNVMEAQGEIAIIGAMYNIETGVVSFS